MKKCRYCSKVLKSNYFENKIGYFCNVDHYNDYLDNLSDEEYIDMQNNFCVCSDE